jgi:energy-coupling factor transporter ATP-binding protein EcfA2
MELPPPPLPTPDPLVSLEEASVGWDTLAPPVLTGINLTIRPAMRLLLLGPTGGGKSALLAALAGHLEPLAGARTAGRGVQLLLWDQGCREALDDERTPVDFLLRLTGGDRADALTLLKSLGLDPFAASRACACLSSGERTLVALATLAAAPKHLLLLDDPAAFLGAAAIDALATCLSPASWAGALVFTTASRRLAEALQPTHTARIVQGRLHLLPRPPCDADFARDADASLPRPTPTLPPPASPPRPCLPASAASASEIGGSSSSPSASCAGRKRGRSGEDGVAAAHPSDLEAVTATAEYARRRFSGAREPGMEQSPAMPPPAMDSVCGRVCRAASVEGFRTLHPDGEALKPFSWVLGGDGLQQILGDGLAMGQRMRLLGFTDEWMRAKLDNGESFRLALFPREAASPASWDGIFALIEAEFPTLAPKVSRLPSPNPSSVPTYRPNY